MNLREKSNKAETVIIMSCNIFLEEPQLQVGLHF